MPDVTVSFTAPSVGASATFVGGDTGTTNANGVVIKSITANTVVGTYNIGAQASGGGNPSTTFVNLTNTPAAADQLVPIARRRTASGLPFDLTVVATDPFGNTDTNYAGTVHFTSSDTDSGVVLPADYSFTSGDAGVVTFPGGAILVTGGNQTITATDTASSINGTATVTVMPSQAPDRNYRSTGALPSAKAIPQGRKASVLDAFFEGDWPADLGLAIVRPRHPMFDWISGADMA